MILLCRDLFNDLCAWRGQFGGTLSGFEVFADGFNEGTLTFLKRGEGLRWQRQKQEQMSHNWGGADSSSV